MDIFAEDGHRLWAQERGAGEPVVCCHGGPGLWDMFEDVALPGRMIRWDQRGCGRSAPGGPYSLARTVDDLDAVRRGFGLDRMALFGHSWGAQVVLRYALDHPERVSKVVYVSGVGIGDRWHAEFRKKFLARLGEDRPRWEELRARERTPEEGRELAVLQWTADFADSSRAREHAEAMATPWFEVNYECNAAIAAEESPREADLVAECRGLAVPVLLVDGAADLRPRWAVDSLAEALPSGERVVLPEVGHVPWLEAPGEFYAAVSGFLTSTT
ncbi:alpha/beta fold hydrolase [Amycolatopsis sp. CA-230715]|uniref:alpha/beta fold hydrolase n=1 Tax=Amycolatopsis sp. CA-230715 TaxID=2745196 RepID=UPI001C0170FB|nr:alpha/beta hydrolase [Amycolatopsis sp. CA-230715]QWF79536.1 Proline iminopeptidase [Amycolatopsis sp. CA-230715]